MTAAVAVAADGDVVLGVDSRATSGGCAFDLADKGPVSYAIPGHPRLLVAAAGAHAINNELVWGWSPPPPAGDDALAFLRACAMSLRDHFTTEPVWTLLRRENSLDGALIAAWRGVVVDIDGDFGIAHHRSGEVAIGSGRDFALGALFATKGRPPEERVRMALEAAADRDVNVASPFTIRWAGR